MAPPRLNSQMKPFARAEDLAAELPTSTHDQVWHVGWFDGRQRSWSAEGRLLSVSEHPDEWTEIAKLGGAPKWELRPVGERGDPRPSRFITVTEIGPQQAERIYRWGQACGLVDAATIWTATWFDDEWEDLMVVQATSRQELEDELCGIDAEITHQDGWVATARLGEQVGRDGKLLRGEEIDPLDHLCALLAEAGGHDGLWWDEMLDPDRLSAPRGGIGAWAWVRWSAQLA